MSLNHEKLIFSASILRRFIDHGLDLAKPRHEITGYELCAPLTKSAAYNTYVETISDKADTLYLRIKERPTVSLTYAYYDYIKRLSEKFGWKEKEVVLAFDYTEEDFYGNVQGFDIHGWTGKSGITGKFKFLVCSMIGDETPEKIPLVTVPISLGHYKSHAILYCLSMIKPLVGKIRLILFDRGFYDLDLIYELGESQYPYLIFVPKHADKKNVLFSMHKGERKVIIHDFTVKRDNQTVKSDTVLIFLKELYDPVSEKDYDWIFATNMDIEILGSVVPVYKKRWRIETGFRVQDEAKIKCKSKMMPVRYFIFLFEQLLQVQWACFYKEEVSFKKFVIEISDVCGYLAEHPKKWYGNA